MAEEKEKPLTREDVKGLIKKHGGPEGLDLSKKVFEEWIDLNQLDLHSMILNNAILTYAQLWEANLRGIHFEGADLHCAYLIRANLGGALLQGVHLTSAHLNETHLESAHLEGASLRNTHFEGASLRNTHLEGAGLRNTHLDGADLREAHLEGAQLEDANLEGANLSFARLEGAYLRNARLEGAYLYRAKFSSDTRLEDVDWGNYSLGEERDWHKTGKSHFLSWAEATYRQLKQWYTNAGLYDIAGEFFFKEMTVKRKVMKWRPNPFPRVWSKFISLICGYGERPFRAIVWAVSVVAGMALIYFLIGSVWEWGALWKSLYFSSVSFTALGYGSWPNITNDWIRGLGAFESFIGIFTIALFLITFVRKMTR